jgi:PTS system mannitol-specific IIC component
MSLQNPLSEQCHRSGRVLSAGNAASFRNGKIDFFMVASNPGPGLGLLLGFAIFGKGMSKKSAPGAMIIHFLGGIHELYFPYVLMKPLTLIGMIAGGMTGTWVFYLLNGGLVAGLSPGSIFAYLALTPKGSFLATIAGVTRERLSPLLLPLNPENGKERRNRK